MSLRVNLRHLEEHSLHLEGRIEVSELDIDTHDDIIQLVKPLDYDLTVQLLEGGLLVQGSLSLTLECQCVRCLKRFKHLLKLDPWTTHLPLQGEDTAPAVNDCVDLTPSVREDILLEFPQHPLCDQDCRGLRGTSNGKSKTSSSIAGLEQGSPVWSELNKLKF